ncbi:hypothetical protein BIV23_00130 [Streptomyces monashensis]|uniref:Glucanase n=1 Tax=Streptomyces monashensis TaxID=1678012 RepID=A0A1S2QS65_9ACTN|nr:hypothetical protein BIV23_00130 [Streptomyces monashensis]
MRRAAMVAPASAVAVIGSVTGMLTATGHADGHGHDADRAVPAATRASVPAPRSAAPEPEPSPSTPEPNPRRTPPASAPTRTARPRPAAPAPPLLYRHPGSQVLDWVRAHPGDPRTALIAARIADQPAAVWFTDPDTGAIAARVRAVTAGAAARDRVPVLVPYAIPDRDCGGASGGGAPDLAAYDAWIDAFARGLGPVVTFPSAPRRLHSSRGAPPLAAPGESPSTSGTRTSARHSPSLRPGGPPEHAPDVARPPFGRRRECDDRPWRG